MNRNKNAAKTKQSGKNANGKYTGKNSKQKNDRDYKPRQTDMSDAKPLDRDGRANDPNYYFADREMADQVTQISFQQLAGLPIELSADTELEVPNIITLCINPSPGVTKMSDYKSGAINKAAGINLAGFKYFSMLSAYTGRTQAYAPQDVSTMILAMGELLSTEEFIRRAFGVAFTMNMRNRSYPRAILEQGMKIDPEDLFENYSNYRTRFNTIITLINQLPIPKGVEYLRKCLEMYQKIFLDYPSDMAQTIIPCPWSTWILKEVEGITGSVLKTEPLLAGPGYADIRSEAIKMDVYLDKLEEIVGNLLTSSTLQVIYTDMLNLATKVKQEFWKLDYLAEGYTVMPEYNEGFMLQFHNCNIAGSPDAQQATVLDDERGVYVTAYNDVIPNPDINCLYYNPVFKPLNRTTEFPRTGHSIIVDMMNDNPSVEDRVEVARLASISGMTLFTEGKLVDAVLPDHYVTCIAIHTNVASDSREYSFTTSVLPRFDSEDNRYYFEEASTFMSMIDWAPHFFEVDYTSGGFTGRYSGDLNFYTVLDEVWLRKVNQFIALGLYVQR